MTEKVREPEKAEGGSEVRRLMVKEIEESLRTPFLFVTQYQGLSVKDLEELRRKLRPISSRYVVTKNSLTHLALKALGCENLVSFVSGQAGFVTGQNDPIGISKVLIGYVKDHEALKLCGGVADEEFLTADRIREFARLPSRDVLVGKTIFLMKSPLSHIAGVLSGTVRKLLYALQEISKKIEGGGSS